MRGTKFSTPSVAVSELPISAYEMSERRACRLIEADRKTVRYRSRRARDEALRGRLRELAAEQRRFGYRRLHILLRAEGHVLNRKKTQRLYREESLTVRRRKGRKRATGMRAPISWSAPWELERLELEFSACDSLAGKEQCR